MQCVGGRTKGIGYKVLWTGEIELLERATSRQSLNYELVASAQCHAHGGNHSKKRSWM